MQRPVTNKNYSFSRSRASPKSVGRTVSIPVGPSSPADGSCVIAGATEAGGLVDVEAAVTSQLLYQIGVPVSSTT